MTKVGRVNCGSDVPLYGFNIRHMTTIQLSIKEGYVSRMLNQDWHHSGRTLMEDELIANSIMADQIQNETLGEVPKIKLSD